MPKLMTLYSVRAEEFVGGYVCNYISGFYSLFRILACLISWFFVRVSFSTPLNKSRRNQGPAVDKERGLST